ncbi:hypothetical protein ACP4OV_006583 [Aristida adscensionis]
MDTEHSAASAAAAGGIIDALDEVQRRLAESSAQLLVAAAIAGELGSGAFAGDGGATARLEEVRRQAAAVSAQARALHGDIARVLAAQDPPPPNTEAAAEAEAEQVVTPWEVSAAAGKAGIDYDKVVEQFGCERVGGALVERVARLTGAPPHRFLRRGIFFAQRDVEAVLDAYERGEGFYLYTGRGPSSEALHLGHLVPFMFAKYLQDAFKVPLVIQLTDDEKFLWMKNLTTEETKRLARENAKDIIACGFDRDKTFIFSNFRHVGGAFYENMIKISSKVTLNSIRATFGTKMEDPIGKALFPIVQAAPSFPSSFPHLFGANKQLRCLIPCAIDQDPYFRMSRDVAPRLSYHKPSLIESRFFPALQGENTKMSASNPNSAIYVTDGHKEIKKKVMKFAFSGGQDTQELHRKLGANLDVDVSIKYLNFFLEDDDELERIKQEYKEGRMLTGQVKQRLIDVLYDLVDAHQKARASVTEEMVDEFMAVRPLPNMFL